MKAAFYQFTPSFGRKEENIAKVISAVKGADLELIVLPEFFATGYQFTSIDEVADLSEPIPDGNTTKALSDLSKEKGIYIVAGLPEKEGDKFYNSAVFTGPEGFIGSYRKTHLFFEEKLYFSPGDTGFRVWDTPIGKIGIMICFDWFFPESARSLALMGAEVIAHPANLVLPFCPDAMPVRCLENRVYAITANRTGTEEREEGKALTFIGKSEIVSPKAEILVRAGEDEEALMIVDIDPKTASDKSLNPFNDILKDRREDIYEG
ncbi:(R)-stereoselective amidase [bacterium BMS3Bbin09]|nr:(R)-stereoselective amidase [bacterium BMS3Bbin09]